MSEDKSLEIANWISYAIDDDEHEVYELLERKAAKMWDGQGERVIIKLSDGSIYNIEVQPLADWYDPEIGDDKECACGHMYYRHFDSYEDWAPVGCKYCACDTFQEKQ